LTTAFHRNERLAKVEQRVDHLEEELDGMALKVTEMHAVLMQARGARWAIVGLVGLIVPLSGAVGFFASHWK